MLHWCSKYWAPLWAHGSTLQHISNARLTCRTRPCLASISHVLHASRNARLDAASSGAHSSGLTASLRGSAQRTSSRQGAARCDSDCGCDCNDDAATGCGLDTPCGLSTSVWIPDPVSREGSIYAAAAESALMLVMMPSAVPCEPDIAPDGLSPDSAARGTQQDTDGLEAQQTAAIDCCVVPVEWA